MTKKRIIINAFDQDVATHHGHGMWRYPGSRDAEYKSIDYWTELARICEKGKFDAIFIADVLGVEDVYKGSPALAIKFPGFMPQNDPVLTISAMAAVTEHLGFGVTMATTYEYPYLVARKFTTLDHLTNGRIAWNVVTGYQKSGAVNLGLTDLVPHDERYEIADEFLEVTYKLWEGSWEDDAVLVDKENGVYADPTKVHPIDHEGKYFTVPGVHSAEPSPQRTPFIYQAGQSEVGKRFAAKHCEGMFVSTSRKEILKPLVDDVRQKAEEAGRPRDSIKIIQALVVIAAETDEAAQEKLARCKELAIPEGTLVQLSSVTGIDFSKYDLDEPLEYIHSEALQAGVAFFTTADPDRQWTLRQVMEFMEIADWNPIICGGPETCADELESWIDETGADGFNLGRVVSHETMSDFVEFVVPELQRRGRMWTDYPEGHNTLRGNTYDGSPFVADWHPASEFRGAYVGKRSAVDMGSETLDPA
ncbi:MAG TPA: LLM class flavin-dependent oxidoreductase [Baekduia sp.]|nr:LLM class flavin-dependent oxidoreductase [Baekduia sp.]